MTTIGERVAGVPLKQLFRYATQIAPVYWRELHHPGYTAAECVVVDMSYWCEDGIFRNPPHLRSRTGNLPDPDLCD